MKKSIYTVLMIIMMMVMTACGGGDKSKPPADGSSTVEVNPAMHYGLAEDEAIIVLNREKLESKAVLRDGHWYVPSSVAYKIDARFYVNKREEQMIFTDAQKSTHYYPGINTCVVGDQTQTLGYTPFLMSGDGTCLVAIDLIEEKSASKILNFSDPGRIMIWTESGATPCYMTNKDNVCLRTGPTNKYEIITKLLNGSIVYSTGEAVAEYFMVVTEDGYVGYISYNDVETSENNIVINHSEPEYMHRKLGDGFQTAVWHNMIYPADGQLITGEINGSEGIDVIIPTWYSVISVDGELSSNANYDYVNTAHGLGMKVFGLIDDFTPDVKGYDVYSNSTARLRIVDTLISSAREYGLDGINVDFEYITEESAPHYLQLLRELYLETSKYGLYLTICDYVPTESSACYNLPMQNMVADYIMLMAYDEHYSPSDIGSVASQNFVATGLAGTIESIPADKVMLGVPFYTRAWISNGDGTYSMEILTMRRQNEIINTRDVSINFDNEAGQNICTYTNANGKLVTMWCEDDKSLTIKRQIANNYNAAGIVCWALGQQVHSVWDIIR